jgi:hypothetical protein
MDFAQGGLMALFILFFTPGDCCRVNTLNQPHATAEDPR